VTPLHITIDHLRAACGRAQPGEPYVTMAQLAAYDTPVETLAAVGLVRCLPCGDARSRYESEGGN